MNGCGKGFHVITAFAAARQEIPYFCSHHSARTQNAIIADQYSSPLSLSLSRRALTPRRHERRQRDNTARLCGRCWVNGRGRGNLRHLESSHRRPGVDATASDGVQRRQRAFSHLQVHYRRGACVGQTRKVIVSSMLNHARIREVFGP